MPMPKPKFLKTATAVLVATVLGFTLCGCGAGAKRQPTGQPTPSRSAMATPAPTTSAEKPFAQEVPLYRETGTKKYTKTDANGKLVCDDKSTIARPLSTRGTISIDGILVETRNYSVESSSSKSSPMMDIIYPRTLPVRAVIVNEKGMGVVRIPKDGDYFAKIRLVIDVPTFVSYGGITSLTACVAKPQPKKKTGKK